jgi:cellulose synthase/poly-beta-1,6-N-acetylglucosamine synthase-like glycosyltransferase
MQIVESILLVLFLLVELVLAFYLLLPFFFLLSYGILKLFRAKTAFERQPDLTDKNFEFGIIITAHQETQFVIPLVDSILKQEYKHFYVYIVADDCNTSELQFNDERIRVLKPEPALHSKIKSIHYGLSEFTGQHDAVIILDADNLIHPSFLSVMNQYFRKGYKVVQADFKPKNTDTHYARMDAIGDMFNFFLEREARMWLNLSAAIWGSGVAIDLALYKEVQYADFLGGFDKKLQSHLVRRVKRIAFAPAAILYDEKITSGKSLENQRTRWISSYFKYFGESLNILFTGIKRGSLNLVYFSLITLRPPLFLVVGFSFIAAFINYFINPVHFYAWLIILAAFFLSFITIVIIKGRDKRFLLTFLLLPLFAARQLLALLKLKKARKSFMKTEHSRLVYIDDLLKK